MCLKGEKWVRFRYGEEQGWICGELSVKGTPRSVVVSLWIHRCVRRAQAPDSGECVQKRVHRHLRDAPCQVAGRTLPNASTGVLEMRRNGRHGHDYLPAATASTTTTMCVACGEGEGRGRMFLMAPSKQ